MERRYIVNADDFGMNADVNRAIVRAFNEGLISSTTLMANMPGFDEACELARANNLQGMIGVHLNLTEEAPLTSEFRSALRFVDEGGNFAFTIPRYTLTLRRAEVRAIRAEWGAQIRRCIERGITPSHLDSHHHVHTVWPLLSVAMGLARGIGIPFVRMSRNVGAVEGRAKRLYKVAMNRRLRASGLAGVRHLGNPADLASVHHRLAGRIEVMVHPVLHQETVVEDGPDRELLHDLIDAMGIMGKMLSYSDCHSR